MAATQLVMVTVLMAGVNVPVRLAHYKACFALKQSDIQKVSISQDAKHPTLVSHRNMRRRGAFKRAIKR